jgi:hypothetical protein
MWLMAAPLKTGLPVVDAEPTAGETGISPNLKCATRTPASQTGRWQLFAAKKN